MWSVPWYFEYEIVAGPGDVVQKWIRIFTPGSWRIMSSTMVAPPDALPSIFRERKKFCSFETCYILDGTGGTSPDEQLRTTSLPTHYCEHFRDWDTRSGFSYFLMFLVLIESSDALPFSASGI